MTRFRSVLWLGMLAVVLIGCRPHPKPLQLENIEEYIADSSSVGFDIVPLPSVNGSSLWLATYASQGKVARFKFELEKAAGGDSGSAGDIQIESGKGSFQAVPGSDDSVLLSDLMKALEAKSHPKHVQRASSLPFTYAILGKNQSQTPGGGFNPKPPGHWTAMKVFIGSGEQIGSSEEIDEGEIYLNFNPATKKGQFSIKDSDYGDYLIAKFATVL
jgi:hypothetical protein